ncbi:type I-C CRISPR-associated protein Cas7/Csd2 [Deinococcus sp. 6YEL10]|uniref:type I-C CRISPR-associated protein Cas7/Csd2 n=1 Tax=Deinococcus sp. 6YEL10 TaxID=2745870 RepID=UPI001E3F4800|nr:type I-C CRISPR-associated protein Cas7/Csd2 [Deinococcus sp. 6YEL10]MCD0160029.1 type I-C CRISPR-associated protein Cas7/Csd2 [Deinococcus sp. 6YEL10]
MTEPHLNPTVLNPDVRHEFVLLFDVTNGNPNGDPDAGNMPRIDPENGHGLVTDVALKRKVRNYVDALRGQEDRFKIYVQQGAILNNQHGRAYTALGKDPKKDKTQKDISQARQWMCDNFFDVRTFGAVMSTEVNAGQVRGPVQFTFARSQDPILGLDFAITRVALTNPDKKQDATDETARSGTMGRKAFVPYGLYMAHGFYVPTFAADTGFGAEDLKVLWQALENMWDLDRSASRGLTACRGLYVFSHDSKLGNAPAHKLLGRITLKRTNNELAPREFKDYDVQVDDANLPQGVTLTRLVEG